MTGGDAVDRMIAEWGEREPDLDVSVFSVIGRLYRCVEEVHGTIVETLSTFGLSYADFDVMNTLRRRGDQGGTHPRELAKSSLRTSGAITARLDRLVAAGHVERETDPDDRRAVRVRLTAAGERLATEALTAVLAVDESFLEPLDVRQRTALAATLKQLLVRQNAG